MTRDPEPTLSGGTSPWKMRGKCGNTVSEWIPLWISCANCAIRFPTSNWRQHRTPGFRTGSVWWFQEFLTSGVRLVAARSIDSREGTGCTLAFWGEFWTPQSPKLRSSDHVARRWKHLPEIASSWDHRKWHLDVAQHTYWVKLLAAVGWTPSLVQLSSCKCFAFCKLFSSFIAAPLGNTFRATDDSWFI